MVLNGGKGVIFLTHFFPVCEECLCLTDIKTHTIIGSISEASKISCLLLFKMKASTKYLICYITSKQLCPCMGKVKGQPERKELLESYSVCYSVRCQ